MPIQVHQACESFVANWTIKRSLSSMNSTVSRQIVCLYEGFSANSTVKRTFPCMDSFMLVQVGRLRKCHAADLTLERSLTGVNALMTLFVMCIVEALTTILATVRPKIGMDSPVDFQSIFGRQKLATNAALELPFHSTKLTT